jgi:hypothetical protein|tara:strand:+ start:1177 stop:1317 length:141 start_codon:yes stop_codon:yes gene_type:complete
MLEQIKKWLIEVSKEICGSSVKTAGTICDETKKANSKLIKAIMDSI